MLAHRFRKLDNAPMKSRGLLRWLAVLAAIGCLAGCGSSGNKAATTHSPRASTSAASGLSTATQKLIAADWTAFFDAKTPVARRIVLLQDGPVFASLIRAQAHSSLASSASAKVTKVTVESATKAKVIYSILVAGSIGLSNQSGVAVYQAHTWKVGLASFCGLLSLENGGSTKKLPSVCKSTG
jgi:hypothetical protein